MIIRLRTCVLVVVVVGMYSPFTGAQARSAASNHAIQVERMGAGATKPLMILLHGVSGPSAFYREQAEFFASHGYRVVLPHYLDAGHGSTATNENYEAWTAAVRKIMDDSRDGSPSPIVIAGYSLGASVALAIGSQGRGPDAIAEFYGSLPDQYFRDLKGMPPLLILHGVQDQIIPVNNALQLAELCSRAELKCDMHLYPGEGHGFSPEVLRDANRRTLQFLLQVLGTEANATHALPSK